MLPVLLDMMVPLSRGICWVDLNFGDTLFSENIQAWRLGCLPCVRWNPGLLPVWLDILTSLAGIMSVGLQVV